jgi:tetratricopeptide (TPR) repeat protein
LQEVGPGRSTGETEFWIRTFLNQQGPVIRASVAYNNHDLVRALALYTEAIAGARSRRGAAALLWERGKLQATMGRVVPALSDFKASLDEMRQMDSAQFLFVYDSKALLEFSVGMGHEQNQELDSAVAAYGRATQEDLSFYPAHLHLALLALRRADTTTALSEMQLASQLGDRDATVHFVYGYMLAIALKPTEAEAELRRAITLEPFFASPYMLLGQVLENDRPADALAQYKLFLAHAALADPRREDVQQRIASLAP